MTYGPVKRDIGKKVPSTVVELLAFFRQELLDSYRQCREVVNRLTKDVDSGSIQLGAVTVRSVTGIPTQLDPDGSLAISDVGVFSRQGGAWVAL